MAATFIQGAVGVQASVASKAMTFASAQTAGNLIIVVVGYLGTNTITASVADTSLNTYRTAVPLLNDGGSTLQQIFYAKNINAAGAGVNIVTVTFSSTVSDTECSIHEYFCLAGGDISIDAIYSSASGLPANTLSSITTTKDGDFLFAADVTGGGFTSAPATWNQRELDNSLGGLITADRIATAAGTYMFQPSTTSGGGIQQIVAFALPPVAVRSYQGKFVPAI